MDKIVINDLIQQCWLDSTGSPIELSDAEELSSHDQLFIASVVFTGTDQGSLTIIMSELMAKTIAAKMFDYSLDAVTYDDIHDAIGELANVIAGNLKTEIFGNSMLSKPLIMQGNDSILSTFKVDTIFEKVYTDSTQEQVIIQICQAG